MTIVAMTPAQQIVDELTGRDVRVVPDPTLDPENRRVPSARAPRLEATGFDAPPKDLADLPVALNRSYEVTLTRAGELSIPVIGSVGGGTNRRVVILERVAYKPVPGPNGVEHHYGYALRLCVTVNKWDANAKISLPFLAASAQLGQTQASWTMQVLGLTGPKVNAAAIPPTELNVETFVLAKQSLTALIEAVDDPSTHFAAQLIASVATLDKRHEELRIGAARTFALSRLARRTPLPDALRRLSSDEPILNSAVEDVYDLLGASDGQRPTDSAAKKARDLLGAIDADV